MTTTGLGPSIAPILEVADPVADAACPEISGGADAGQSARHRDEMPPAGSAPGVLLACATERIEFNSKVVEC